MPPLNTYKKDVFSQFGEDGIIEQIFKVLPAQPQYHCIEFGAWDGKHLSNTHRLITEKGWHGVLIEGSRAKFRELQKTYAGNENAVLLNRMVDSDGANSLDNILKETGIPKDFDLLSIDIDGNDFWVWHGVRQYRPKVVVIEFNPSIPSDINFVQMKDANVNQGSSLLSIVTLANLKGYELIATTKCNAFFARRDIYLIFRIEDNSIGALWDTETPAPRVFQLYDGTLVLSEGFKMRWHNVRVGKLDLQVLPKALRSYGDAVGFWGKVRRLIRTVYLKLS